MRRLAAVAVGLLAVVGMAAPAGAAGVPAVGVVSANDYVNGSCAAGNNARSFTATLLGTYPVSASGLQVAALAFHAFHSCSGQLGAVSLTGHTMNGAAVAPSCTGSSFSAPGGISISINLVCQAGSLHYRLQIVTVRDALSVVNPSTVGHGLIGLPGYLGAYTIQVG